MRKNILTALVTLLGYAANAQNTFPTSGNVGIGTTGPNSLLQINVAEDSKPANVVSPSQSVFKMSRSGTANYSYPEAAEFRIGHGGPGVWGSKLDLYVNGENNQNSIPDRHSMTWLYNGNVGVGTTNPLDPLDVKNIFRISGFNRNWRIMSHVADGNLYFRDETATNMVMTLTAGGNVGIGTTNPTDKLSVNGKIRAQEIKVETANWPDYVFEQDYKILGLSELDGYIKINKHLPDLPSAKEAEANGIALGEMNKLLLKKIEELTLHLIEKDKEIGKLKASNTKVNIAFNDILERITKLEINNK